MAAPRGLHRRPRLLVREILCLRQFGDTGLEGKFHSVSCQVIGPVVLPCVKQYFCLGDPPVSELLKSGPVHRATSRTPLCRKPSTQDTVALEPRPVRQGRFGEFIMAMGTASLTVI